MYREQDLREAVTAGAISEAAAEAMRSHVAQMRAMPSVDEENSASSTRSTTSS